jgi:hypothetical protein
MSKLLRNTVRVAAAATFLALVVWGVHSARQFYLARQTGAAISACLNREWPQRETPQPGTREVLLSAAGRMEKGDWSAAVAELASAESISPEQRAAASQFFFKQDLLRQRYVSAVSGARSAEQEGTDMGIVRVVLKRALLAASRGDRSSVESHVSAAHAALEALSYDEPGRATVPEKETVAGLLTQVGPSFLAGQELLLEGHAGVEKLLRRARRFFEDGDYGKTAALTRLAAELSGVDAAAVVTDEIPDWFMSLEPAAPASAAKQSAESAVGLCESMAAASEPSEPVSRLIRNAKRDLAAERFDDAYWWATVALNALGMPDEAVPK